MTVISTRDALAKALEALLDSDAETPEQAADTLIASGAVIDADPLRALISDWQANGGSRPLGDPCANVWHEAARQLLDALSDRAS